MNLNETKEYFTAILAFFFAEEQVIKKTPVDLRVVDG